MSLRKRIMLLVTIGLIVATAPLGVMGIGMLRAATDRILAERLAMARAVAGHLDGLLAREVRQFDLLNRQIWPLWAARDDDGLRAVLATAASQIALASGGLFLMDSAGRLVVQEPAVPLLGEPPLDLRSVRETLTTGRPTASELMRSAAGIPMVLVTVPLRDPGGTIVGIVGGIIDLRKPTLAAFVRDLAVGRSGHAALVNAEGVVLASTDPAEVFSRNEHPEFFSELIGRGQEIVGATEENHGQAGQRETHIMAGAPLTTMPWGLAVGQSEEETFGPIRRLRDRVMLFALAVLAAALLFAWLDTGAVAAPLRLLKEAAEAIAGGDLRRPIEVRRSDEVGTLATSFETMRLRLLDSLGEIRRRAEASQSLYEVGTEVLSLRDRAAVLQSVALRAHNLLRSDVALVCLLDESQQAVRVAASVGSTPAVGRQRRIAVSVEEVVRECLACPVLEPQYRVAHLAAPLAIGSRTVGALCVGTRAQRIFSAEDRDVLHGLATLAAIAVENARLQDRVQSVAMLEERERIAREMHDGVGQVLGYVNIKAQAVQVLLDTGKVPEAQAQLAQLEQAAREVYADLREAILGLRAETSPDRRLVSVLEEYVSRFNELSGVATELIAEGDSTRYDLGPTTELHVLRIIQEALTNVRKHARARRARVQFAERDGMLAVTVTDDGVGFDSGRVAVGWPRFGLQTMRERAEAIGGTFSVHSRAGEGTEVEVRLPLSHGRADARSIGG